MKIIAKTAHGMDFLAYDTRDIGETATCKNCPYTLGLGARCSSPGESQGTKALCTQIAAEHGMENMFLALVKDTPDMRLKLISHCLSTN